MLPLQLGDQELLLLAFCDPLLSRSFACPGLVGIRRRARSPQEEDTVHFRLSLTVDPSASRKGQQGGAGQYSRVASGSVSVFYRGQSAKEPLWLPLRLSRRLGHALEDLDNFAQQHDSYLAPRNSTGTGTGKGRAAGEGLLGGPVRVVFSF